MNKESDVRIEDIVSELDRPFIVDLFSDNAFRNNFKGFLQYMQKQGAERIIDAYNLLKTRKIDPKIVGLWVEEGFLESKNIKNEILIDGIANAYPEFKSELKEKSLNYLSDEEKEHFFSQISGAYEHINALKYMSIKFIDDHFLALKTYKEGFSELLSISEDELFTINGPYDYLDNLGYTTFSAAYSALENTLIDASVVDIWISENLVDRLSRLDYGHLKNSIIKGHYLSD